MMSSAAEVFGPGCLGVIMTGMGRDGADGCAAIRAAGGYVLGQDEATSDVYGMNKVAFVEGNVDRPVRPGRCRPHCPSPGQPRLAFGGGGRRREVENCLEKQPRRRPPYPPIPPAGIHQDSVLS